MDVQLIKALSDGSRLKIVELLMRHPYCVRALSRKLGLSESAISQHMKVLRDVGLVEGVKYGYFTHYRINRELIASLAAQLQALSGAERVHYTSVQGCDAAADIGCRAVYADKEEGRTTPC